MTIRHTKLIDKERPGAASGGAGWMGSGSPNKCPNDAAGRASTTHTDAGDGVDVEITEVAAAVSAAAPDGVVDGATAGASAATAGTVASGRDNSGAAKSAERATPKAGGNPQVHMRSGRNVKH